MSKFYHVAKADGTKCGQMPLEEIFARKERGELSDDALYWEKGMPQWQPLSTLSRSVPPTPTTTTKWNILSACRSAYGKRRYRLKGRASRAEYWYIQLFNSFLILLYVLSQLNGDPNVFEAFNIIGLIVFLVLIIPNICLTVRRLHDIGLNGWFSLLGLIPYLGALFLFICALIPSGAPNKWGDSADAPV